MEEQMGFGVADAWDKVVVDLIVWSFSNRWHNGTLRKRTRLNTLNGLWYPRRCVVLKQSFSSWFQYTYTFLTGCWMGAGVIAVTVVAEGWELKRMTWFWFPNGLLKEFDLTGMLGCHVGISCPLLGDDWAGAEDDWGQVVWCPGILML